MIDILLVLVLFVWLFFSVFSDNIYDMREDILASTKYNKYTPEKMSDESNKSKEDSNKSVGNIDRYLQRRYENGRIYKDIVGADKIQKSS